MPSFIRTRVLPEANSPAAYVEQSRRESPCVYCYQAADNLISCRLLIWSKFWPLSKDMIADYVKTADAVFFDIIVC